MSIYLIMDETAKAAWENPYSDFHDQFGRIPRKALWFHMYRMMENQELVGEPITEGKYAGKTAVRLNLPTLMKIGERTAAYHDGTKEPVEIPERMPFSGRYGTNRLHVLRQMADHFQKQIDTPGKRPKSYIRSELKALEWAIEQVVKYELLLAGELK